MWSLLKKNILAVLSFMIAVLAFQYSMWRAVKNEHNNNTRAAAFSVLSELSKLQVTVDHLYYTHTVSQGAEVSAWGHVTMVVDLSRLLNEDVQVQALELKDAWAKSSSTIREKEDSNELVTREIRDTKREVVKLLDDLM